MQWSARDPDGLSPECCWGLPGGCASVQATATHTLLHPQGESVMMSLEAQMYMSLSSHMHIETMQMVNYNLGFAQF